jgi:hypothetical protein
MAALMTIGPRSRSNRVKLTYETGMAICKRLFPIRERRESLSRQLQEDGFSAFLPGEAYRKFYGYDELELVVKAHLIRMVESGATILQISGIRILIEITTAAGTQVSGHEG